MENQQKKLPKRRFEEFENDGEWEQRKFLDSFRFPVTTNSLSRAMLNYDSGEVKSIHYGDILIKFPSILDIRSEEIPFITNETVEKYRKNLLVNGDIIFADAAEDETVGKVVEVQGIIDGYIVSGLHTIVARPNQRYPKYFLGYYINSSNYHKQLLRLIQGSKISSISKSNLQETTVTLPSKYEEQKKIGCFFKQLDETIALQKRKLDKLMKQKEAYLAEMFPVEGESVPKRRFKEFENDEEWKIYSISEVSETFSGGTPTVGKKEFYDGEIPFIRSGEISSIKTELCISALGLKNSSAKLVNKGDILYALYGATSGEVSITQINGAINQAILAIQPNDNYNTNFITQWLIKQKSRIVSEYLQGGQGNLSGTIVKGLKIQVPKNPLEQEKVGNLFKSFDKNISLQQQKLDNLKALKEAYLNEMFV